MWGPRDDEEEEVFSDPLSGFESTVESILDPTRGEEDEEG